jgi:hypothetical protein
MATKRSADGNAPGDSEQGIDAGAFIGKEPELAQETIPGGVQRGDERISGVATQSTGPGKGSANPDDGWTDWPEGHREGRAADDDMVKRKG